MLVAAVSLNGETFGDSDRPAARASPEGLPLPHGM